ncbi:MAG TPA: hypothetical protein VF743_06935 [Acidimicrobiales bacterium]
MASQVTPEPTATVGGDAYRRPSGWAGWIVFAAVMMIIVGVLNAIHGLVAIFNDDWVVFGNTANLYLDITAWGWIHLVIGAAVAAAGFGVLTGNVLARTVAVLLAGASLIANFLYMPAYPVWALTIIAIDVFVIYALVVHGRDVAMD